MAYTGAAQVLLILCSSYIVVPYPRMRQVLHGAHGISWDGTVNVIQALSPTRAICEILGETSIARVAKSQQHI